MNNTGRVMNGFIITREMETFLYQLWFNNKLLSIARKRGLTLDVIQAIKEKHIRVLGEKKGMEIASGELEKIYKKTTFSEHELSEFHQTIKHALEQADKHKIPFEIQNHFLKLGEDMRSFDEQMNSLEKIELLDNELLNERMEKAKAIYLERGLSKVKSSSPLITKFKDYLLGEKICIGKFKNYLNTVSY